jgi:hypothetical protein
MYHARWVQVVAYRLYQDTELGVIFFLRLVELNGQHRFKGKIRIFEIDVPVPPGRRVDYRQKIVDCSTRDAVRRSSHSVLNYDGITYFKQRTVLFVNINTELRLCPAGNKSYRTIPGVIPREMGSALRQGILDQSSRSPRTKYA